MLKISCRILFLCVNYSCARVAARLRGPLAVAVRTRAGRALGQCQARHWARNSRAAWIARKPQRLYWWCFKPPQWHFPSVTKIRPSEEEPYWTTQLWRPESFHFLVGGRICALLYVISSISRLFCSICASRRFSAAIYRFFSCVIVPRVL